MHTIRILCQPIGNHEPRNTTTNNYVIIAAKERCIEIAVIKTEG